MENNTKQQAKTKSAKLNNCPFCQGVAEFVINKSNQIILQHHPISGKCCPARCEIYCETFEFGFDIWND